MKTDFEEFQANLEKVYGKKMTDIYGNGYDRMEMEITFEDGSIFEVICINESGEVIVSKKGEKSPADKEVFSIILNYMQEFEDLVDFIW